MRYPFVLFDVGETLVGPRESFGATYARVLAPLGIDRPAAAFETALRDTWKELDRTIPKGTDRYRFFDDGEEGYWRRFAHATLARVADEALADALAGEAVARLRAAFLTASAWEVFPDVVPALSALRRDGARLAVVSNWDSRLPAILDLLGLSSFFEVITVSHLEGVEKPDAELFRRALTRLGAMPNQALHVGDMPDLDLAGASAAGIDALLVDRKGRLGQACTALPDLSSLPKIARGS